MHRSSTVASADDASQLQAALDKLSTRVDVFERNLQQAMDAERTFRLSLQTVSRALDAFVHAHTQEDELLSRLIQEDTQRSRDAKDEYDVLAARFDDSLRPHASSRRRELLKTVSLYIGIVLSIVFMAPLHLIVSLFENLLFRMGYRRLNDPSHAYADATARYRARQNWRRTSNATSFTKTQGTRHHLAGSDMHPERASVSTSLRSTQGSSTHSSTLSLGVLPDSQLQSTRLDVPGAGPQEETAWVGESLANIPVKARRNANLDRAAGENGDDSDESPDEEDKFVDAMGDAESVYGSVKNKDSGTRDGSDGDTGGVRESQKRKENDTDKRDSDKKSDARANYELRRPDWACPFDDDQSPPETTKFPSGDFWKISDAEINIDFIKHEDDFPIKQE